MSLCTASPADSQLTSIRFPSASLVQMHVDKSSLVTPQFTCRSSTSRRIFKSNTDAQCTIYKLSCFERQNHRNNLAMIIEGTAFNYLPTKCVTYTLSLPAHLSRIGYRRLPVCYEYHSVTSIFKIEPYITQNRQRYPTLGTYAKLLIYLIKIHQFFAFCCRSNLECFKLYKSLILAFMFFL